MSIISEEITRKFIDSIDLTDLEIETDTGWKPVIKILKTIPYNKWKIVTDSGLMLECADTHIVFDENFNELYVKDINKNKTKIQTINGAELVIDVKELDEKEEMFDVTVASVEHRFYSSGILSHNTTIFNALSYALYSWPISFIKKEHLINKTNGKNMVVTVEFEINGKAYKIVRGLRPRILEFYENGISKISKDMEVDDSAQGDNRETQKEIEKILGMSHDMFCQIVTLNTYTQPFLLQKVSEQRNIIEQLLGITLLSEKAEKLKEELRITRDKISREEGRIQGVQTANKRIQNQIAKLIEDRDDWTKNKDKKLKDIESSLDTLINIDIDVEIKLHAQWDNYNLLKTQKKALNNKLSEKNKLLSKEKIRMNKLTESLHTLENQYCSVCHQKISGEIHTELTNKNKVELEQCTSEINKLQAGINEINNSLALIPELVEPPKKHYETLNEAYNHKNKLALLAQEYEQLYNMVNPFTNQVNTMQNTAIEPVDLSEMNNLTLLGNHQEFLMKLLTNKDSFIRKSIIDKNLNFLNSRLNYYLTSLGLPHEVSFQTDLNVNISELGRELSVGNLSRGEMTRLSLGLSFAFRDVWECLYQKINLLAIDEAIDSGIDSNGTYQAIKLLRDMNREQHRDVWLISHKEELLSKCSAVLTVKKENGYTTFSLS
jgi:DNA repair exonuclease SbcCD ATPase subunit